MQFVTPQPFDEAVDKLGRRSLIGSKLRSDEWADVPVELRDRAFFSSQVESIRFLQRARDGIADFLQSNREVLPNGQTALKTGSRADFVKQMQEFLAKEGVVRDTGGLTDITSQRRLGLIFDVQTRQSDDFGYWKQGMDPDTLDAFPAQRFIRVLDVKQERDSHQPFEDQVYLKTDPIWANEINDDFNVPWGPWGWGCGHDVEDVDRDETESLGLLSPGQPVTPDERAFNDNLKASTAGLDPDLLTKLKTEFGDQLIIEGDTMRWADPAPVPQPTAPAAPTAPLPTTPEPQPIPQPAPATPPSPPRSGRGQGEVSNLPSLPPTAPPTATPVSQALDLKVTGALRKSLTTAMQAIDSVHGDGILPKIPVKAARGQRALGTFKSRSGQADSIEIKRAGRWPALTMVHESGHFLDLEAIGTKGTYATSNDPSMRAIIATARKTQAIQQLQSQHDQSTDRHFRKWMNYMLGDKEIWARSYAQYVAEKSGDATLLADLDNARTIQPGRQWAKADFAPIAGGIDTMFEQLGWKKK